MISTLDRIESLGNSSLGMIEEQRDFVRDCVVVFLKRIKFLKKSIIIKKWLTL